MEDKSHTKSNHLVYTDKLCRVCGLRVQTVAPRDSGKKARKATHLYQTILNFFNINVMRDTHLHSTSICDSCYSKLKYFELKHVTESTLRAAQKLKTTVFWREFKDNITIKECSLCHHYLSLGKAGRKRKVPRTPHYEASRNENSFTYQTLPHNLKK